MNDYPTLLGINETPNQASKDYIDTQWTGTQADFDLVPLMLLKDTGGIWLDTYMLVSASCYYLFLFLKAQYPTGTLSLSQCIIILPSCESLRP